MKENIKLLKALADDTRFKIIKSLLDREKCVCEIVPYVKKTQPTVSFHLSNLEDAGVLESRREGKKIFYKIKDKRVYDVFKAISFPDKQYGKNLVKKKGVLKIAKKGLDEKLNAKFEIKSAVEAKNEN